MKNWLKYVAFGIIAVMGGLLIADTIKVAKRLDDSSWKNTLFVALLLTILLIAFVAFNYLINRNWIPGKWMFTISLF